jgi:membrane protein implicated in regulation of membrane protease activity
VNDTNPRTLLLILVGVVPLVVAITVLVSFLLLRAGYGLLVAGLLPFVAMVLVVAVMGVVFGRAANKRRVPDGDRSSREPDDRRSGRRDDV